MTRAALEEDVDDPAEFLDQLLQFVLPPGTRQPPFGEEPEFFRMLLVLNGLYLGLADCRPHGSGRLMRTRVRTMRAVVQGLGALVVIPPKPQIPGRPTNPVPPAHLRHREDATLDIRHKPRSLIDHCDLAPWQGHLLGARQPGASVKDQPRIVCKGSTRVVPGLLPNTIKPDPIKLMHQAGAYVFRGSAVAQGALTENGYPHDADPSVPRKPVRRRRRVEPRAGDVAERKLQITPLVSALGPGCRDDRPGEHPAGMMQL